MGLCTTKAHLVPDYKAPDCKAPKPHQEIYTGAPQWRISTGTSLLQISSQGIKASKEWFRDRYGKAEGECTAEAPCVSYRHAQTLLCATVAMRSVVQVCGLTPSNGETPCLIPSCFCLWCVCKCFQGKLKQKHLVKLRSGNVRGPTHRILVVHHRADARPESVIPVFIEGMHAQSAASTCHVHMPTPCAERPLCHPMKL